MKAIIRLEAIGFGFLKSKKVNRKGWRFAHSISPRRPWVAEIAGYSERFGYDRRFLPHDTDFVESSGTTMRLVYFNFLVQSHSVYQVHELISWRHHYRYFAVVDASGMIKKINEWEVSQRLLKNVVNNRA